MRPTRVTAGSRSGSNRKPIHTIGSRGIECRHRELADDGAGALRAREARLVLDLKFRRDDWDAIAAGADYRVVRSIDDLGGLI